MSATPVINNLQEGKSLVELVTGVAHNELDIHPTIEVTSRFSNLSQFRTDLEALGFDVVSVQDMWKFTHIRAMKTERRFQEQVELGF
jgi:hypothetical protein